MDFSATVLDPSQIVALELELGDVSTVGLQLAGTLDGVVTPLSSTSATVTSQLASFTPATGSLTAPVPNEFRFRPVPGALSGQDVSCKVASNTVTRAGSIPVIAQKYGARIKARVVDKVLNPDQKAVVKVKVKTTAGQKAVGKVKAKVRGVKAKSKTLRNGKTRFVFRGLKLGKSKIRIKFLGNAFTNTAKKKVRVRVVR